MDKRTVWVLIETEADRFTDIVASPTISDTYDILGNPVNYVILDVCDQDDLMVKLDK